MELDIVIAYLKEVLNRTNDVLVNAESLNGKKKFISHMTRKKKQFENAIKILSKAERN